MKNLLRNRLVLALSRFFLVILLGLGFSVLLFLAVVSHPAPGLSYPTLVALPLAFMVALWHPMRAFLAVAHSLVRQLYGLEDEEEGIEKDFITHRFLGLPMRPPYPYTLRVEGGRVSPEAHPILRKLGGPGFISIAHDSAVVTARAGRLERVLGPGFFKLRPFEYVWDVVDLRPQKRTVRVEATTRDGVPVYCDAEIRFHIDAGDQKPSVERPYPFLEDAVFRAAVRQRRRAGKAIQRWESRVADGILDGEVRDRLERLWLDEIVLPDDQQKTSLLKTLEQEVQQAVREAARGLGVVVEEVQLGPIMPLEEDVSKQWLESWRAIWQQQISSDLAQGEAASILYGERARIMAQANFLARMGEALKPYQNVEVPPALVMMKFLEVMRSLSDSDPAVRSLMFNEAESLRRLVTDLTASLEGPRGGTEGQAGTAASLPSPTEQRG